MKKDKADFREKLTWDQIYPIPFASFWCILDKIMMLNHMSFREVMQVCSLSGYPLNVERNHYLGNSSWVNFPHISILLNVEESSLRNGFLDQIGFNPYRLSGFSYVIRNCRECKKLDYHCILFDLAMVEECPWHGIKLEEEKIVNCIRLFNNQYMVHMDEMKRNSSHCTDIGNNSCGNVLAPSIVDERMLIRDYCNSFIGWWKNTIRAVDGHHELLQKACLVGRVSGSQRHVFENIVGLAHSVIGEPSGWRLTSSPANMRICSRRSSETFENLSSECYAIRSDVGSCFRSIVRHFKRHHLKRHRRCISILTSISGSERLMLKGDSVCTFAMAYVLWRMELDGSRFARRSGGKRLPTTFRLYGGSSMNLDDNSRLLMSYLNFFTIYRELAENLGTATVDIMPLEWLPEKMTPFLSYETKEQENSLTGEPKLFIKWVVPNISMTVHKNKCNSPKEDYKWTGELPSLKKREPSIWKGPQRWSEKIYRVLARDFLKNAKRHTINIGYFKEVP